MPQPQKSPDEGPFPPPTADIAPGRVSRRPLKPHPKVLVVDDDPAMGRMLRIVLEGLGYRLLWSRSVSDGIAQAARSRPDAVIFELDLPDGAGLAVLGGVREWSDVPVLILSGRSSITDKVEALDAGANDYLVKPFAAEELAARLRVLLRYAPPDHGPLLVSGPLRIDMATRETTVASHPVSLTATEEAVLHLLACHAGKFVPRVRMIRAVWGFDAPGKAHDLKVHIARLRRKLHDLGGEGLICTKAGLGYCLPLDAALHVSHPNAAA